MKIIILAGGSGTRLWPLSRKNYPKQFLKFKQLNKLSLFQLTFLNALKLVKEKDIIVITNNKYKFLVRNEISSLKKKVYKENIISEPVGKNTLPAISLGMDFLNLEENALILSSDHLIKNPQELFNKINLAEKLSQKNLVLFGIKPRKPHTGYGYFKIDENSSKVIEFKEKPDYEIAKKYIDENYLWNSGIFFFKKKIFLEEIKKYNKKLYDLLNEKKLIENFENLEDISIDYGIIEKSDLISGISTNLIWDDLGSFDSIYDNFDKDENNNSISGHCLALNSKNNLILNESKKVISLNNIDDLIIINTIDAILISKKEKSQNIKEIVKNIKEIDEDLVVWNRIINRPWGRITILDNKKNYRVNKVEVFPGEEISFQYHKKRDEFWTIIKGRSDVIINKKKKKLNIGQSIHIKKGDLHSIKNTGKEILEFIEIQSGIIDREDIFKIKT